MEGPQTVTHGRGEVASVSLRAWSIFLHVLALLWGDFAVML
jgi:hypothetical protein